MITILNIVKGVIKTCINLIISPTAYLTSGKLYRMQKHEIFNILEFMNIVVI